MAASQFLHAVPPEVTSHKSFSGVPKNVRVKPQLCEVDVPPQAIAELKRLVHMARLGPETFGNSQAEPNTKYGLTRSWIEEAVRTWTDESAFNW